jgi:hypothetical protein
MTQPSSGHKSVAAWSSETLVPIYEINPIINNTMYQVRLSLFWDVTQLMLVLVTDVSGQPIGSIFRGQAVKDWDR